VAEAHLERVASDGPAYLLGEYQVVTTGGSSGRRGVFMWDFEGWLGFALARERPTFWLRRAAGGDRDVRRAFVAAAHSTHPTAILPRTFAGSPQLGVGRSFPATLPLAEIVKGLNAFHPTDLFAYPSMMHRLASELRSGRLSISPWELNCGAEPLLAEARAEIEAAFGRPVMNLYAAAEAGVIARSYPGSAGLHLNEDIAVYEPVDLESRPVAAGITAAKLLVTNVINHSFPLIRYELADELTVLREPNPGPWTGRRIADVEGRIEGTFIYGGGVEVHLHLFRSALGRRRQTLEYQVRQTPTGADIAIRTSAPLDTDAVSRELVEGLAELGVARPQVSVAEVQEIERTGSTGKLRRFVPLA
jgi:phenylacetate-CoA ligase